MHVAHPMAVQWATPVKAHPRQFEQRLGKAFLRLEASDSPTSRCKGKTSFHITMADPRIFNEREAYDALMRTRKLYGRYFGPGGTVRQSSDNPLLHGPKGPLSEESVKRVKYVLQQAVARRFRTWKAIKANHHVELKAPNPDQHNRPRVELEARKELAAARMEAPPMSHHKMEGGYKAFGQKSAYVRKLIATPMSNYRRSMLHGIPADESSSSSSDDEPQFHKHVRAWKRAKQI